MAEGESLMSLKVSIIIACCEINSYTRECIKNCLSLDYPNCEVLVLPDSEPNVDCAEIIVIPTGSVAPSEKRDISVDYAKGEVLAFIDDDAYPSRKWLKEAIKYFEDENIAAVCGPGVTPPNDSRLAKAGGVILSSYLGSGSLRFRYKASRKREVDDFPSCNFMIRKSDFIECGKFGTHFWPGEDTKLCLEITRGLHKKIIYDPKVLVYHHRRKLFEPHLKQVWNYSVHRGYFAKKLPQTSLKIFYFLPSLFCLCMLFAIPASIFNPIVRVVFIFLITIYILLALLSSFQTKDIKLVPLILLGIILTHIIYGIGFIKGLLMVRLSR